MRSTPPHQALVAIDGALSLIAVLLIVQMWLLSATLESFLGGHYAVVVPAAAVSFVLCAVCVVLSAFVRNAGRQDR